MLTKIAHQKSVLVGAMLTMAVVGHGQPQDSPHTRLHRLFAEHHAWQLEESPEMAMSQGDYTRADRISDISLAATERRFKLTQEFAAKLEAIPRAELSATDQLYYDLFGLELSDAIEGHKFRAFLAPVGGRFGPQQSIPQMHERVRFRDATDFENYIKRLERTPQLIDDTIGLLELGRAEKRVPPRVCMQGVPGQFKSLDDGKLAMLLEPVGYASASLTSEQRTEFKRRLEAETLPRVRSALAKLGEYVNKTYLPSCRESIAAIDWPNGEAFYAYQLRTMTTTPLTAREIHETGLREVARIRSEMMGVIARSDFAQNVPEAAGLQGEALFKRFIQYLRTDPRFYHKTPAELLAGYRDVCKRIDETLPKLFREMPRLPYGVRPIPAFMAAAQTTAYYSQGDVRNGEPGIFYANTYALDQRPKYEMVALAMHEAVPGHHFQIALAQELPDAPEFRKNAWFHAFGEGWALYSERLGLDVGLYTDPYDDFGRLLYEMWRACRLVVDPGMHALGWSRERAVQFMLDNTALSELNINNEIDRYIAWPGQACAYKLGELKIREIRARAEKALGARFDVRAFHEALLGAGTLPLTVLEKRMGEWMEGQDGRGPSATSSGRGASGAVR